MKIVIMHETITKHDAIGNDIFNMYNILTEKFECYVYCTNLLNNKLKRIDENKLYEIIENKENLIIYHHSIFWKNGEDILKRSKAKIIFIYHNITPKYFFEPYNDEYFLSCELGRQQTERFVNSYPDALWLCASEYNLNEINALHKFVIPPFNNLRAWDDIKPIDKILSNLIYSNDINLMFVGRVAPNKGHKTMIEILRDYIEHYDDKIKLYLIGKKDEGLIKYNSELNYLISKYKLEQKVVFVGEVTDQILLSYYLGCDFFICTSEHEGFCVPIVEAQYLRLPVLAKNTTAIPETIGNNQILLEDDIRCYSSAIKIITENENYKQYLIENGYKNCVSRFDNEIIAKTFKKYLHNYLGVAF
jgi:glycosyltransferase involved in cell wall biosynthesis